MIKKLTIELDVLPITDLVLTEKSQWIWARDLTKGWSEWERIRVWRDGRNNFGGPNIRWSTDSSDIKYQRDGLPPYTHYVILPDIEVKC